MPKKKAGSQAEMMTQVVASCKSKTDVDRSARVVYAFLIDEKSPLRSYLSALCDGGVYFVSNVHCKAACAAVRFRKETEESVAGITPEEFSLAIQGRLCE